MYRFLVRLVIFALVIAISLYIGVQWKLKEDLKYIADKLAPNITFDYQSSSLTPSGKIVVTDISLYVRSQDLNMSVGKVEYSAGSIWDMAFFKNQLDDKKLPKKMYLSIDNLIIPLTPTLVKTIALFERRSTWDTLNSSACGDVKSFGINEYLNMGYDFIVLSSESEFYQDSYSGNLVARGSVDIEETSKVSYQFNLSGIYEAVGSSISDENMPTFESLNIDFQDTGYNRHRNEFCSLKTGLSADKYIEKHIKTIVDTLKSVGIQMTLASQRSYKDFLQPSSRFQISMEPKPSFSVDDFGYYDENELRDILGLKLSVNDQNVESVFDQWSLEKFEQIVIEGTAIENNDLFKPRYENVLIKRSFEKESLSSVGKFINYKVKVIRNDGKIFQGKLTKINDNKLFISMMIEKGIVKISVETGLVKEFFVYR